MMVEDQVLPDAEPVRHLVLCGRDSVFTPMFALMPSSPLGSSTHAGSDKVREGVSGTKANTAQSRLTSLAKAQERE